MKKLLLSLAAIGLLCGAQSCVVVTEKHDNGRHNGWYKNPNNPHHPNTTNPGQSKGKGKSK